MFWRLGVRHVCGDMDVDGDIEMEIREEEKKKKKMMVMMEGVGFSLRSF
jgi:hypothetical protein